MKRDHGRSDLTKELEMPAGEFKGRCLKLMDEVSRRRTSVVITKRGKPVAKLVPIEQPGTDLFGCMKGTGRAVGDIVGPVGERWDVER
jgi:prevent-host-death family protein